MSLQKGLMLTMVAFLLPGCSGVNPEQYADTEPVFRLEEYFLGDVVAHGIFQSRSGEVKRRFRVDIAGRMEGDELVLDEDFHYADGETDRRVWRIRRIDEHRYEGRAGDVVGVAEGQRYGNALNWRYTLALEASGRTWHVQFNDWMFLQEDGVLINRAEVTKFGFRVGEVTIAFRKE